MSEAKKVAIGILSGVFSIAVLFALILIQLAYLQVRPNVGIPARTPAAQENEARHAAGSCAGVRTGV
jgi:hypothetical protein